MNGVYVLLFVLIGVGLTVWSIWTAPRADQWRELYGDKPRDRQAVAVMNPAEELWTAATRLRERADALNQAAGLPSLRREWWTLAHWLDYVAHLQQHEQLRAREKEVALTLARLINGSSS